MTDTVAVARSRPALIAIVVYALRTCVAGRRSLGLVAAVLAAASRMQPEVENAWRLKVPNTAKSFTPNNVYIYRPGVAALCLLEGAVWFPVLTDDKE